MKFLLPFVFAVVASALPVRAEDVRELSQAEIRAAVESGDSVDLSSVLTSVTGVVAGELVSVRSFLAGGVFYQVLVLRPDGRMVMLIVDGRTGTVLPSTSEAAKVVREAAKAADQAVTKAAMGKSNGNNGNAGGNGNGNSGGNGNGNSGGNGNGNSGGNGNGNGNGNN